MSTKDFVCNALRLYNGTSNYIDRLCENFEIDPQYSDVYNALSSCGNDYSDFGNFLIYVCFRLIIDKAVREYPEYGNDLPDQFDIYLDDFASSMIFYKKEVHTWEELQEEIEAWKEQQEEISTWND